MVEEGEEGEFSVTYLDKECETTSYISRAGPARVTYPNGDIYEGGFNIKKKKHGNGVYTWNVDIPETEGEEESTRKQEYSGNWSNGRKHGIGTMTYVNGESYSGQWSAGKRQGCGTYKYTNGDVYSGLWLRGQRHGNGTYSYANRSFINGVWNEGTLEGEGTWNLSDTSSFKGTFLNNCPDGEGIFSFPNGKTQSGIFGRFRTKEQVTKGSEGILQWNGEPVPL